MNYNVAEYLRSKGISFKVVKRPTGQWAIFNCPFCKDTKKKFGVNLESGGFKCFRENSCGVTGSFNDLRVHYGDKPIRRSKEMTTINTKTDNNLVYLKKEYSKPTTELHLYILQSNQANTYKKIKGWNFRGKFCRSGGPHLAV